LREWRIIECGNLHYFLRDSILKAVLSALEFPGVPENLFEGLFTVVKVDPGVGVPVRTPEPDGEVPRHVSSPLFLMIPVCRESSGGQRGRFPEK
jgi:hypothetical protein